MSTLRQAAQQALEALKFIGQALPWPAGRQAKDAITALRAALAEHDRLAGIEAIEKDAGIHVSQQAEPEQEPDGISWLKRDSGYFTAPTPRKPLTDEEIDRVTDQQWAQNNHKPIYAAHRAYARAIERAHGIGEQHGS